MLSSRGSSQPRDWTWVSYIGRLVLPGKPLKVCTNAHTKKWVTIGSGKYVNWHYCGNHCKIHTYIKALNHVYPKFTQLFLSAKLVTPWTAAHLASLSFTVSWSLLNLMSIESVMPSNHLFPCCPQNLYDVICQLYHNKALEKRILYFFPHIILQWITLYGNKNFSSTL